MCTKDQVKEALIEILYDHNEDGESIVGQEVNRHITNKGNQIITKLTLRFGVAFISMLITAAGAYYALIHRVDAVELVTVKNASEIEKGGRWTREDQAARDAEIQRQILDLKAADAQLREDQIEATNIIRSDIRELRGLILAQ